MSIKGK